MTITAPSIELPKIEISEELIRRFDSLGPRYTSYPTADRFNDKFDEHIYIKYLQQPSSAPLSIYVHLPFCASICYYCGCNKIITKDHGRSAKYLRYLEKEMALATSHLQGKRQVAQLHLGGGTPTFLSSDELHELMDMLRKYFDFAPDAELGIEIDPRTVNDTMLGMLAGLGFNRTSLGVQDFDPEVQKAVNRIQPVAMVENAITASRAAGFLSVNFDLIYGLPKQNLGSFSTTLDEVIRLSPDRIALYNYAHLPARFKPQRRIVESELPPAEERLQIFLMSLRRLLDAGYVYIGLDHFAKPDDDLTRAQASKTLHRNFQGYTTRAECDLIGLGVSSIGKVGHSYSQSIGTLEDYYARLDAGQLPIKKGFELSMDDVLRRHIIMNFMCSEPIDFDAINKMYVIDFIEYFSQEIKRLQPYLDAGLITLGANSISVTPKGRMFVRAVGMVFDKYLQQATTAQYSRLI
ncbi:MAG: oxygen-independent coproporphyrinogen III oxidase [Gallionellales bacterium 35-53-114]|jgi:oxygen-independent coproporphyrinogen-3 oxidase|nr:MAG: oxygen-independent coproporphyrinogen III oxidase [Gallionellales bacterium 35-53-114]OYZ62144.1 MAG: oxygen-independent coproporphyrinogen III oxidase [Gallionellales bacterium 24-53-125]OZB07294.1 MAG: oxygen-independent coproporphyrinogen III oxidase [Gallionellales bacterium 39-52-133]HQS59861.1 oxygen-independent coproporphyrinogen III oxidase [Gallionellaceae bacterium]HQS76615.1 oxygen-independent coproporphyrinogen III oxidase [Gallionellaceae bacterium]